MRRANLRRIATLIERAVDALEVDGVFAPTIRKAIEAIRREADAGQPRRIRRLWLRGGRPRRSGRRADDWINT